MTTQPTVLYVEDDAPSRRVMKLLLKMEMGLEHVTIFDDSRDFVAKVEALNPKPDIVLLDIHVQPLNGFQMLSLLRHMPALAQVPVVALTASVMSEEVYQLRQAGFHSVIAKPVDIDTFPQILGRILAGEAIWRVIEPH
ncbi:MAG: response regulator [Anaerolineae bacterium]